jgi:hypothetical protein
MKLRFTPILLVIVIVFAAILSRFIGSSDYIFAETRSISGYKSFYCPYNNYLYKGPGAPKPPYPYRTYPTIRIPYPYPLPKQYPCPCNTPAINMLLNDVDDDD